MRNILKKISGLNLLSWIAPLLIFFVCVLLSYKSYSPNTYLTGWDTLHPEFNIRHAFESIFWGVWRSDQGLGAIAAHSHMSELPRLIYLYVVSFILPENFLRYSYFFLTLFIAPLGMYFFSKRFLKVNKSIGLMLASLITSLSYLLNLGTVQRYAVPFEMFATQFAFLPLLFLFAVSYINNSRKRYLGLFTLISFLASSQSYAATLFYAFASIFSLSLFIYSLISKDKRTYLKRLFVVLSFLLISNLYWLLPNIYSIKNQSTDVSNAKINELFTPEARLHNAEYGDFTDVITQKSYLFSWQSYDFNSGQFNDLLSTWNNHLNRKEVMIIPILFAVMSFFGITVSVLKRNRLGISFILPTFISIFFLMNTNGPFSGVFTYLQSNSGLFAEGFRDPFTKFSILFSFFISFYIGVFLSFIYGLFSKVKKVNIIPFLATSFLFFLLIFLMKPAFSEGLINPIVRVAIPQEYFETFNWFKNKDGRVAQLPLNSMWGWQYNSWGYQGAGFVWFGINNPYLTRDFDRWSPQNETFYNELSRAYYDSDTERFEKVLLKYQVHYLLLDGSIIDTSNSDDSQVAEQMETFVSKIKDIKKSAQFGKLIIYETPYGNTSTYIPAVLTQVDTNSLYSKIDYTFDQYGDYVYSQNGVIKPFVNFDSRFINLTNNENWLNLSKEITSNVDSIVTIPSFLKREEILPVSVEVQKSSSKFLVKFNLILPKVKINSDEIEESPIYITYPLKSNANVGYLSVEQNVFDIKNVEEDEKFHFIGNVYVRNTGSTIIQLFSRKIIRNGNFFTDLTLQKASQCNDPAKKFELKHTDRDITLESNGESVCVGSLLTIPTGGLIEMKFVTPHGQSPLFCLNKIGKDGCVNILLPHAESAFGGRQIIYNIPAQKSEYWAAFVAQSTPGTNTNTSYNDISIGYYPEVSNGLIDFGTSYKLFSSEKNIQIKNPRDISVSVFVPSIISENFGVERGHPHAVNCNLAEVGHVTKEFNSQGVTYSATDNGVSCDYFDYPQLLQTQAYLMKVSGKNIDGRSLKFYLENKETRHMDFEELLPTNEFSSNYIIEPFKNGSGGYVINMETRSFGKISSTNTISEISFSPIPTKWLSEISIGPKTLVTKNNNLKVSQLWHFGLITRFTSNGSGTFAFNNAYEKGWVAIDNNNKFLKHVTINGWENGWEVTPATSTITVFYLPQLLEILGFIAMFFSAILLLFRRK